MTVSLFRTVRKGLDVRGCNKTMDIFTFSGHLSTEKRLQKVRNSFNVLRCYRESIGRQETVTYIDC